MLTDSIVFILHPSLSGYPEPCFSKFQECMEHVLFRFSFFLLGHNWEGRKLLGLDSWPERVGCSQEQCQPKPARPESCLEQLKYF